MNSKTNSEKNTNGGAARKFTPGILTYGSLKPLIFGGAVRMDRELRELARQRDPKARNRRQQEVIYQWNIKDNNFWMRLYSTLDTDGLITRAQRTGHAKLRLTVRDDKSKQVLEFASKSLEIARDQTGWEPAVKEMMDRAYLFVSRLRPQCPKCRQSLMEIRTGTRGQFWGCQQFPDCRGTRNIPEATAQNIISPVEIIEQAPSSVAAARRQARRAPVEAVQAL